MGADNLIGGFAVVCAGVFGFYFCFKCIVDSTAKGKNKPASLSDFVDDFKFAIEKTLKLSFGMKLMLLPLLVYKAVARTALATSALFFLGVVSIGGGIMFNSTLAEEILRYFFECFKMLMSKVFSTEAPASSILIPGMLLTPFLLKTGLSPTWLFIG